MSPEQDKTRDREHEERVAEIVTMFLDARTFFDQCIGRFRHDGSVLFGPINEFVEGSLFDLKESCHYLFRPPDGSCALEATPGSLFDVLIGSIFHTMMKIKENVYQIETYAPTISLMRSQVSGREVPAFESDFFAASARIVKRAEGSLRDDFADAEELFREATGNVRFLLRQNADNGLLVRRLIENEHLVDRVFDETSVADLLSFMTDGHPAAAYLAAARSYREGAWSDKARQLARTVLELDPLNPDAQALIKN